LAGAPPGRVSDSGLLWFLWPDTKGFRGILALGLFLIVLASLIGVILPYLTKVAIDGYILPLGRRLAVDSREAVPPELLGVLKADDLLYSGTPGVFFLEPGKAGKLDPLSEKALIRLGILDKDFWYLKKRGDLGLDPEELERLGEESGRRIELHPDFVAARERDLPLLSGSVTLILRGADLRGLKRLALFFVIVMIAGYFAELGQRVLLETGSQRLGHQLRERLLIKLFTLPQSYLDRQEAGRLTTRATSDVNNVSILVKSTASTFFSDLLSLLGATVVMFSLHWKLALITVVLSPLVLFATRIFGKIARTQQRDLRSKVSRINQLFSESHAGMALIQAFNREKRSAAEFGALNDANYRTGMLQLRAFAIFLPVVDLVSSTALALVLWFGGNMVLENTVSLGVLAAFAVYCGRFFAPIKDLAEKMNNFQSAFASIERIKSVMEEPGEEEAAAPLPPKIPGKTAEFKNVSFRYRPELPLALKDVTFKLREGETVALVGETGSGKSSVVNLMLRFYDPERGEILFDGVPLKRLDLTLHRRRVGLVTQDVFLYSGTVMDNLKLGRTEVPDRVALKAAEAAGAARFIEKLPRGYLEPLGPEGRTLSAGERQLLACARALVNAPEFIILDEATAFVDSESELLISEAMNTLFEGRSSIVVAHRLSTIRKAHRILVFSRGRIVEEGTHAELVSLGGLYHHLALLQGLSEDAERGFERG
jgi:ABC-type multidrug transport system fused ATPase/permease subunit